jgi:hypothetical protein
MSGTICPLSKTYGGNSFSEYEEPNQWREKFKPLQDTYFESIANEKVRPAVHFEKEPVLDLTARRKEVIKESIDIEKVVIPIHNVDPSIEYSARSSRLKELEEEEKKIKSMFELRSDDEE